MFLLVLLVTVSMIEIFGSTSPPVLDIPKSYLVDNARSARLFKFYPNGVRHLNEAHKPVLPYGEPSDKVQELVEWIESVPVAQRLQKIGKARPITRRPAYLRALGTEWYSKYLLSSLFIDVR